MARSLKNITLVAGALIMGTFTMTSCTENPDSPGLEYMPDMYRSPAIEAYVDYGFYRETDHPWLREKQTARNPAKHTIPYYSDPEMAKVMLPYGRPAPATYNASHGLYGWNLAKSEDADPYAAAAADSNPIEINPDNADELLGEAEIIYTKMCMHCHGENGEGKSKIAQAQLLNVPSYKDASIKSLKEGQIFFSITYGKGAMGAHAMMLNKRERWLLTHYVKALQNDGSYPFKKNADPAPADTANAVVADSTEADSPS